MNIPFDIIYVISYVGNIDKQQKIKEYLNNIWQINFEFIYGIDSNNLINIFNIRNIHFVKENDKYDIGHISCAIAHYTAIQHAYLHNYNSCLIIEDDAIFTEDLNYIEYCFNNIPKDADICRFGLTWREDKLDNYSNFWIYNEPCVGAQCYSINNKKTMNEYINNMNNYFREADDNSLINNAKIYQLKKLIAKDPASSLNIN